MKNSRHYSKSKLYSVWRSMRSRCRNRNFEYSKYYVDKGISVCTDWENSFLVFEDWAIKTGYKEGLELDRIDNNGNYCPENCRWVTRREQCNNMTNNKVLSYNGESHTISQWCEIVKINRSTMAARLRRGWSVEKCFEMPIKHEMFHGYNGGVKV